MSENIIQYVAAASNGDTDAMAKLYAKTLKASYFLAYTLSNDKDKALEITKKSYAKAFCTIDKLKRPEAFEIWMKQNVALVYKEGVKFVFSDADAGAVENSSEFLTEEIYNDEEASAKILSAVSELRPELRAAIVLHYNNGMPVNILAKFFGVSESTSNALLGKARNEILSAVELDSSNIENGNLPVLTKIFQRAATAIAIENSFVRDIFIYAIDAYEASKPAEPVQEEVVPAPAAAAPVEEAPAVVQETVPEQAEEPVEEEEVASAPVTSSEDSNVISFKQKINEILSGESVSEDIQTETESDVQDEIVVPEFVSEEKTQEAIEHFSSYENNDVNNDLVVSDNKKKKFDLKINKKLIAIVCASLVALIVICVAISKIAGGDKPGKTPSNNDTSGVVDTLASGYDWRAGGFAECSEINYLDENCISFKSVSTGKYGLLDYQGNVILQPNYDGFRHCRTGRDYTNSGIYHSLVVIGTEEYEIDVINGNVTISDTPHLDHTLSSETLGDKSYEERDRYFEGYAAARKDGKWGYVSQERDKKVIPYEYEPVNEYPSALDYAGSDYCRPVTDGHIAVKKNGMMGIINLENDIVVPFEYSNIMPGKNGVYIACKGGTWGVILLGDAVSSFAGINISIDPVTPDNSEDTTGTSSAYDSYTVISESGANVRDGAGADYDKIGELKYGDTVRAYDTQRADNGNKWVKIRYEGKYGWVAMSNLEEEGV